MHLVDRETQLDVLGEMLAACERSQGGAAFLHGAVASGKTVFVDAFVERAKSRAEVLCAVASRSEREIQFGVVSQLTDHPGLPAEDVAEVIGIIDEASRLDIPATADPDKIHPKLARSLARLSTALMRLAGDRPLVIVVDDLHHADKLSLDFLQYLTRRILNKRVLVVLTLVPGALPMHPLFWADILRQAGSRRINLPLLSRGAVFRLLTAQMGAHNAKRLAERCLELSGGNPLLVNALLKDGLGVWECPDKELTTTDASAYCEAVAACLRHSDPRVIEYAHGLAVLDVSNAADLIGPLLSLGDEAIRTLRCSLEGLGILTDSGFRHPVIRAAVLDEMRPERRADLHLQVAQLLYHEGAPVEDVANHLRWANRSATPWAVSVLQEAAEQALRADEVSRASEYLRLALRGAASEEKSAALTLVLARIDWRLNPSAVERHIAPLTESLLKGQLNVGQSVQLIRNLLHQGWLGEAEEAIRLLGDTSDLQGSTERDALRLWLECSYPLYARHLRPSDGDMSVCATPDTDTYLLAASLQHSALKGGVISATLVVAEEKLRALSLNDDTLQPLTAAIHALIYADRLSEAADWCETLLKEADRRGAPTWQGVMSALKAEICLRRGDLVTAVEQARNALTQVSDRSWGMEIGLPLGSLILALVHQGDLAEVGELLDRPVPDGMLRTRFGLHYQYARGHYYLAMCRPSAALQEFDTCGRRMREWEMDQPAFFPWRSDSAYALQKLGRTEEAHALALEQLQLVGPMHFRTRGLSLRAVAATSADPRVRLKPLGQAIECMRDEMDRLELSKILWDMGRTHLSLSEPVHADHFIRKARENAAACNAQRLLQTIDQQSCALLTGEPDSPGEDQNGISALSEAEQRVAMLVVKGQTNSEVAESLFITVSTVEQHLTRIYRKLGIKRRRSLRTIYHRWLADNY